MSVLDEILAGVRADLAERQAVRSLDDLKAIAARQPSPRGALGVLRSPGVHVIAEVKRRSPSRGPLAADRRPGRARPRVRGRRRERDQRADRADLLRRITR